MALDQINEALLLFEHLQNESSVSDHVVANLEAFLSTPLTPLASTWDSFAGDYFSNAEGNGMFYAVLTWAGIYSLYERFMNIALRRSPWTSYRKFELLDAFWYIIVHTILLLVSLWMVDPGYVADILRFDLWSFSWRILMHSVRVVPRNVMLVFTACSAFQIFSALQHIVRDKNKSALQKSCAAVVFIVMYCFRKIQLLLLANASLCLYGAVCEILRAYQIMTVPPIIRRKVTRAPGRKNYLESQLLFLMQIFRVMKKLSTQPLKEMTAKYSAQMTNNRQQLQSLYDTVKGALIIKRSLRRHQERRKAEITELEEEGSTVAITEFSETLDDEIDSKISTDALSKTDSIFDNVSIAKQSNNANDVHDTSP